MKKKVLSILLAALMVLPALTACSESAQNTDQPAKTGTDVLRPPRMWAPLKKRRKPSSPARW